MQTIYGLNNIHNKLPPVVLTIGNFDGLHVGHRQILQRVQELARAKRVCSALLTFEPHPTTVLRPEQPVKRLFSLEDLESQLSALGIDYFIIVKFNRELANIEPQYFMQMLLESFSIQGIVVGYDFAYGKNRSGSYDQLVDYGRQNRFEVLKLDAVLEAGEIVSSSLIRKLIAKSHMERVAALLTRPYYLSGEIIHGESRGKQIGFPTANLNCSSEIVPATGVYLSVFEEGIDKWPSLTNIGHKPTFHNNYQLSIETHVLNSSENYYNQRVKVHLLKKMRDEIKFSHIEELTKQIKHDVEYARKYFGV